MMTARAMPVKSMAGIVKEHDTRIWRVLNHYAHESRRGADFSTVTIELCAGLFDWAKFRQTKGAVKLHPLLGHDGYLPVFAHITTGKVHEIKVARAMTFTSDSIVAIDKGHIDYELFWRRTECGVFFVTRQKDNARYRVLEEKPLPVVGTSPNALMIRIWTALVAILILKYLKFRSRFMWSLSSLVATLRYNLFTYRDLWARMDQPFEPPPILPLQDQLSLNWTA